jgi:stearoyl-CoA desaturase (delta-9 desaturase)
MTTPSASPRETLDAESFYSKLSHLPTLIYWGIHGLAVLALFTKPSAGIIALALAMFWVRMFAITGGYHRYFSHKTYKTSRAFQFFLALLGTTCVQKGPLWWAGIHRIHHRESDVPGKDPHSPKDGFWYSHAGWIQDPRWESTPFREIKDLTRYPELRWLNRWHFVPPVVVGVTIFAFGGWPALAWGFFLSTVVLWHATYTINSLSHVFGSRRYETSDTSRNNPWLAILTMGEGWHNNHHHYMASCRNGFFWWEWDPTYYVLRLLGAVGLVWDIREPPASVVEPPQELPEAA